MDRTSARPTGLLSLHLEIALGIAASSVLIAALVLLASTFGIPFTTYTGFYGHEKKQALENLSFVADLKKDRLENWLNEAKGDLSILSTGKSLGALARRIEETVSRPAETGVTSKSVSREIARDPNYANVMARFDAFVKTYERYSKIQLVAADTGSIVVSTAEDETGTTFGSVKAFETTSRSSQEVKVDVEKDPVDLRTYVVLSKSVPYDGTQDASRAGRAPVILAYADMEKLVRPMLYTGEGMGKTGEILLVSQERRALMSLKHSLPDGTIPKALAYQIEATPARLAALGHNGIVESKDYRGVPVWAAYRFIQVSPGQGWGMVVKQDVSEIMAPVWSGGFYTSIIGIIGVVTACVLALAIGRRISKPIDELSEIAEQVGSGNLNVKARTDGPPEIKALAHTFNSMIEDIRNWHDELGRQVELRTTQLVKVNQELHAEIAERKRVEDALRAGEQRYKYLYEKTPVPLHSVNDRFQIIHVSDYWLELLGYSREEVLGKAPVDFLTPASRLQAEQVNIPRFLKQGSAKDVSYQMLKKNGEVIDVLLSAFADRDAEDELVQSLSAFYDVTDLRRTERALQQAHDELEERVLERTAALERSNLELATQIEQRKHTEEKLRSVLADLTTSNQDLEKFAYVASHDLQEPLRNVASCMQLLEKRHKGELGAESDQLITYAVDSVKTMKLLIEDLLAFSRIVTRGKPLEMTDAEEIMKLTIRNLEQSITRAGAVITYDPLPRVRVDRTQLMQVLQNLISNSIKFARGEPPQVHVSARRKGQAWVFSVTDNGIGIDSRFFDRIFIIFQRLHKKIQYGGTGMGLAIVKKIIERHRGEIWVESQPGVGSTFNFTIPDGG